jgi:hypothetical protein
MRSDDGDAREKEEEVVEGVMKEVLGVESDIEVSTVEAVATREKRRRSS